MSTVDEIEEAIEQLKPEEQLQVRDWILEKQPLEDNRDILLPHAYRRKVLDALDQP
ncbi:MAG: hypothetical protein ACREDS_09925 [Limisphaerales bacterium]